MPVTPLERGSSERYQGRKGTMKIIAELYFVFHKAETILDLSYLYVPTNLFFSPASRYQRLLSISAVTRAVLGKTLFP